MIGANTPEPRARCPSFTMVGASRWVWAATLALAAAAPQYGEPVANPAELEQHRLPKCVIPSMYRDKYAPCTLEGAPSDCGDKTPQGATKWQLYGLTAIYVDVDTKRCGFKGIPVYLTSIDGGPRGGHWQLTATDSTFVCRKPDTRCRSSGGGHADALPPPPPPP